METISAIKAKNDFNELLNRVMKGQEVVITRGEKAVARIVPERPTALNSPIDPVSALDALRKRIATRTRCRPKLTTAEVKSAIKEGRH